MTAPTDPEQTSRSRPILPVAVLATAVLVGLATVLWRPGAASEAAAPAPDPATSTACADDVKVMFERKVFCPGNRVEVFKFAGTAKPADTGHPVEVVTDAGRIATVLGAAPSPVTGAPQLARVRWDGQDWPDVNGDSVTLPAFESTIHADHIRLAN